MKCSVTFGQIEKPWHSEGVREESVALSELKNFLELIPEVMLCSTTGYFLIASAEAERKLFEFSKD